MQRDIQTTTRTGTKTRTGIRQVLVPKTVTQNVGDRVISIAFVPFIRSRTIYIRMVQDLNQIQEFILTLIVMNL